MKSSILICAVLTAAAAWGQDAAAGDRFTIPFSDPSRPKMLKANVTNGSITVRGYAGKDVIVEGQSSRSDNRRNLPRRADGLRRIDAGSYGLSAEEQDNVVRVSTSQANGGVHLVIQVPYSTSLQLRSQNDGTILVEHVEGEIDADNLNGDIKLMNVSGVAVAHSLNGEVQVVMDKVQPGKAMSFSSLNGDIDVTLPGDTKARVKMKTDNGEAFSDFEIRLEPNSRPVMEEGRSEKGKYKVRLDKAIYGSINGGGPEMQFTTLNGRIFIRKKK